MKNVLILWMMVLPLCFFAQSIKDIEAMGKEISKPESMYYYDRLEYKYRGLPATLDLDEAKHLYYGRLFLEDKIEVTDARFTELRKAFETGDFQKCATLGRQLYHLDATNLDVLLIMMRGLENTKQLDDLSLHMLQLRTLTNVILASGDGKSEKTAYLVNTIGDEYILLNMLGVDQSYQRQSKPVGDSMLDVWSNDARKIFIKVLNTNLKL